MGNLSKEQRSKHQKDLEEMAQRIFKINPRLSLKQLAAKMKEENGIHPSYGTLGTIYRKLKEDLPCQQ